MAQINVLERMDVEKGQEPIIKDHYHYSMAKPETGLMMMRAPVRTKRVWMIVACFFTAILVLVKQSSVISPDDFRPLRNFTIRLDHKKPMESEDIPMNDNVALPLDLTQQGPRGYHSTDQALNSTLDYEKIIVLNLPKRSDRRDMMSLMGLASGLDLTFFDATSAEEVTSIHLPRVELHEELREKTLTDGQLACYRSNLNILRYIVDNRVQSALIVQDDAEWDMNIKTAFERVQAPLASLIRGVDKKEPKHDNNLLLNKNSVDRWSTARWDILWIGSSYEQPWPDPSRAPYVLYGDDLVTYANSTERGGASIFPGYGLTRATSEGDPLVRLIQQSRRPVGMAAYAVSLSGAAKILAHASSIINQPYDSTVCSLSRQNSAGYRSDGCIMTAPFPRANTSAIRSYSVWPPLISQFRGPDGARDSDLTTKRVRVKGRPLSYGFALEIRTGIREKILSQSWRW